MCFHGPWSWVRVPWNNVAQFTSREIISRTFTDRDHGFSRSVNHCYIWYIRHVSSFNEPETPLTDMISLTSCEGTEQGIRQIRKSDLVVEEQEKRAQHCPHRRYWTSLFFRCFSLVQSISAWIFLSYSIRMSCISRLPSISVGKLRPWVFWLDCIIFHGLLVPFEYASFRASKSTQTDVVLVAFNEVNNSLALALFGYNVGVWLLDLWMKVLHDWQTSEYVDSPLLVQLFFLPCACLLLLDPVHFEYHLSIEVTHHIGDRIEPMLDQNGCPLQHCCSLSMPSFEYSSSIIADVERKRLSSCEQG